MHLKVCLFTGWDTILKKLQNFIHHSQLLKEIYMVQNTMLCLYHILNYKKNKGSLLSSKSSVKEKGYNM